MRKSGSVAEETEFSFAYDRCDVEEASTTQDFGIGDEIVPDNVMCWMCREPCLLQSACMSVQISEPYISMGSTHVEYMRTFVETLSLVWLQTQSSLFIVLAASPIRRMNSGPELL